MLRNLYHDLTHDSFFQARLRTESPRVGKNVKIGVASTEALSSLSYSIFGRGKLVFAETLEGSRTVYNELNFRANSDMSPRCRVIVYYARWPIIIDLLPFVRLFTQPQNFLKLYYCYYCV